MQKRLDPKLRRLVTTSVQTERLRHDVESGVVSAKEGVVEPSRAFKRVLVMLNEDQPPAELAQWTWTPIVGSIYSVSVPVDRLPDLASHPKVQYVESGKAFHPFLDTALAETRADAVHTPPAGTGFTGDGVVVGIIDFGLDYTLDDFRNEDGTTRVAFLWDQSLTPQAGEASPDGFPSGVEYDRAAIDADLNGSGTVRHRFAPGSHGTHVAGIAVGNGRSQDASHPAGRFVGAAPRATIIFVQPDASDHATTFADSVNVAEAVSYVFRKGSELGLPVVINMSLGQNGGSHDGESVVERAIDQLLLVPGRAFVSAAGNEHIWRGHASGQLAEGSVRHLQWKAGGGIPWAFDGGQPLPPGQIGDFTVNEMEIWHSSRDRLAVTVTSPSGSSEELVPGESKLVTFANGNQVFLDYERFTVLNGEARIYVEVSPGTAGRVETGVWDVQLSAEEVREGRFDAFIERDARLHRVRVGGTTFLNFFADQSFFLGTDFDEEMTLGTPATARRSIAVANYDHRTQSANPSSSRGPTRDGRRKPEIAAPGTNIVSSSSMGGRELPDGSIQPVRVSMSGTSMSAPFVAGIVALMLEKSPTLTAIQLQRMVTAATSPLAGIDGFDRAWGFGRADAAAVVDLID